MKNKGMVTRLIENIGRKKGHTERWKLRFLWGLCCVGVMLAPAGPAFWKLLKWTKRNVVRRLHYGGKKFHRCTFLCTDALEESPTTYVELGLKTRGAPRVVLNPGPPDARLLRNVHDHPASRVQGHEKRKLILS